MQCYRLVFWGWEAVQTTLCMLMGKTWKGKGWEGDSG